MYYVVGGRGFLGSAVCEALARHGEVFETIDRQNFARFAGSSCRVLVDCDGNSRRSWADEHPAADFEASVSSVMRSLHDFECELYVYFSSVDVYGDKSEPTRNREDASIDPLQLTPYGLHKWIAETLVRRYARSWLILRLGGLIGPGLKKNPIFDAINGDPLWLSPDSALGMIDTRQVADVLLTLLQLGVRNQVFNVCGTGTFQLAELATLLPGRVSFRREATLRKEICWVNNERLQRVFPVKSSTQAVREFLHERGLVPSE